MTDHPLSVTVSITPAPPAEVHDRRPIVPWREPETWRKPFRGISLDAQCGINDDGPEVA